MRFATFLCPLAFAAFIRAATVPTQSVSSEYEVHERREALHPRWTKRDRVQGHKVLPMRVGLAKTSLDSGYEYLMDISDPSSANFGKHWTSEDVIEAFRPSQQTEEAVKKWLIESGIPEKRITHSDNKGWFAFYATAEEAESLLHTEFHEYEDSVTGGIMPSCEQYHVPSTIRHHIDYVTPGIKLNVPTGSFKGSKRNFMTAKQTPSASSILKPEIQPGRNNLSTCDSTITPACIAALYAISKSNPHPHPNNSMGVYESDLEFYTQKDLDLFFTTFTDIPNGTHPVAANIDGGQQSTKDLYEAGNEVSLDLQCAYPIVYPQTITLYQVDDFVVQANPNDSYTFGFNTFLDALDGSYCTFSAYNETGDDPYLDPQYPDYASGGYTGPLMCGVYKPTNVISISYAGEEADLPISYQKRQCLEYMKLGLQGVSVLLPSGDSGVGDYPAPFGIDGPTGCLGPNLDIFNPMWPSTCPYVTTVGGTEVYPGKTIKEPESAWYYSTIFNGQIYNVSTGGGFSNVYPIPKYQSSAVATYFKDHNPPYPHYSRIVNDTGDIQIKPDIGALAGSSGGIYNRIGRGIPDVAANAYNTAIYVGGNFGLGGGTSAATPIFAAIIDRINEERLNAGKSSIGFLNPSLYANPSMLNDITNGTNPGCSTNGFSAVPGWDPVTGLGTPDYPKMLAYYMSLP